MKSTYWDRPKSCRCCKVFTDCTKDFQTVVDLKGLVLYRPVRETGDVPDGTGQNATKTKKDNVIIFQNTKDVELTSADYLPELEETTLVSCERCRQIMKHAQKLLKRIPAIDKNAVHGICNHCRLKQQSCSQCQEAVKNFHASKEECRGRDNLKERLNEWLNNVRKNLKDAFIQKIGRITDDAVCIRARSEISIDKKCLRNPRMSVRKLIIKDLKEPSMSRDVSLMIKDRDIDSKDRDVTCKSDSELHYANASDDCTAQNRPKKQQNIVIRDVPPVPFPSEDDFTLSRSYNSTDDVRIMRNSYPIIPKHEIMGKSASECRQIFKFKSKTEDKAAVTRPYKDQILPPGVSDQYKHERKNVGEDDERRLIANMDKSYYDKAVSQKTPALLMKSCSEDSLLINKNFRFYFPDEVKVSESLKRYKSSSELIKETQDKLKAIAEEEKKNLKRDVLRKPEEGVKKKMDREEREKIAAEKKSFDEKEKIPSTGDKTKVSKDKPNSGPKRSKEQLKPELKEIQKYEPKEKSKPSPKELQEKKQKEERLRQERDTKEKEKSEKERLKKEKEDKLRKEKEAKAKKKERLKKEKEEKLRQEKEAKAKEKEERERLKKEKEDKLKHEKEAKEKDERERLKKEKEDKSVQEKEAKEKQEKEVKDRLEKEKENQAQKDRESNKKQKELEQKQQGNFKNEERKKTEDILTKQRLLQEEKRKKDGQEPTNVTDNESSKPSKAKHDQAIADIRNALKNRQATEVMTIEEIKIHKKGHIYKKAETCAMCICSDLELQYDDSQMDKKKNRELGDIIIGPKIFKYKPSLIKKTDVDKEVIIPVVFKSKYYEEQAPALTHSPEETPLPIRSPISRKGAKSTVVEPEVPKGGIRYALSDRTFIEKGWTMLPTEKVVRKMNVYRMRPAHPEFDWFEHNKNKRLMEYDSGERLAEFDDNGRGRWYYRNGRLALDYYDAEELNAQQRFVIYSSGEPDERGRPRPYTILATFDYLGNGIVFDHSGKIRLKYNQTEGVLLDRSIGPVSHWKWHTLNDPPALQQVMIDTQMAHKDPDILKMPGQHDRIPKKDNEEMLAIEFDNFIKEKSKKLSQTFKPFQIKMKALKINEHFSLRVLDQATVYLIFRDGTTNLKLNIGMILDHKEIVDTDTAEVGEVSNSVEKFPACTDSLAELQKSVAYAQHFDRCRTDREHRLRRPEPSASVDKLVAAASRPMRFPLRTVPTPTGSTMTSTTNNCYCKCSRKPTPNNVYYENRLF